jgi:hypothetical protein
VWVLIECCLVKLVELLGKLLLHLAAQSNHFLAPLDGCFMILQALLQIACSLSFPLRHLLKHLGILLFLLKHLLVLLVSLLCLLNQLPGNLAVLVNLLYSMLICIHLDHVQTKVCPSIY